jgi:SAM-dependent methyltransferase
MTDQASPAYSLELSDSERDRYRLMAAMARENEADLWNLAGLRPGARVADVGCGPGAVLAELARIVGTDGTAVGVEPGAPARAAAREELDAAGFPDVEVREGDGETTGLEPGAWDVVMMRHVLTHTGEAADRIVAHLATLLAPGGHLYLVDVDLDAFRATPRDPAIEKQFAVYADFHRHLGNDVRMGPRLGPMMRTSGLEVVEHRGFFQRIPAVLVGTGGPLTSAKDAMIAAGTITAEEADAFEGERQRFASVPDAEVWSGIFIAIGRRPTGE